MPYAASELKQPIPLLGGLSPAQFMRRHWQLEPLLIRQAITAFSELCSPQVLWRLARSREVETRLVIKTEEGWQLEYGPFKASRKNHLPDRDWTLLVQGLNHHVAEADRLLRRFDFIPYARLDDLMVSLAAPGGGVGPHFDSYDVFLLQGIGQRRWRLSRQKDLRLVPDAPLKILQRMRAEQEHVLESGDMLYLPPQVAHEGVAVQSSGYCTTYSIGFRSPRTAEAALGFLDWLAETSEFESDEYFRDPGLHATSHPAEIPDSYRRSVIAAIRQLAIDSDAMAEYAGCLATQPKPLTQWPVPDPALSRKAFARRAGQSGIRLSPRSLCLYDDRRLFINGESFEVLEDREVWCQLADHRMLPAAVLSRVGHLDLLHDWYLQGWIVLANTAHP